MAPIDRNEHRQQRMRGAGVANVQTNFSFNLGPLSRPAKQSSLPPQPSSRRTPIESTPRSANGNGSAQRHRSARSASIQRSSAKSKTRSKTPVDGFVTPQARLGKRKRAAVHATTGQTDDEIDELSPDHDRDNAPSIEKSRKAIAPVSPIGEEPDGMPDELSFVDDFTNSVRKVGIAQEPAQKKSPVAATATADALLSSADFTPVTPHPNQVPIDGDDELIMAQPHTVPVRAKTKTPQRSPRDDDGEIDELSPLQVPEPAPKPVTRAKRTVQQPQPTTALKEGQSGANALGQNRRPGVLEDVEVQRPTAATQAVTPLAKTQSTSRPSKRSKTQIVVREDDDDQAEDVVHTTPATNKPRRLKSKSLDVGEDPEEDGFDELSPEGERVMIHQAMPRPRQEKAQVVLSDQESSDGYQESQGEQEDRGPQPRPTPIRRPRSPQRKKAHTKRAKDEPPKKRQKRGPAQVIQVMRLKGFGHVKALTVVDTTRTVMEEWTAHRINRITEKLANVKDSARAKAIRQQRNVVLAYRERLDDVLLDLQDANDTGMASTHKLKQLNAENRRLRSEYLAVQHDRDQIALQNDEATDAFLQEKREAEARNELSSSLYDIEAAIRSGRDKARNEGREDEGPELPIKMLLDNVARNTGPISGLLAKVKNFNGVLDRAAGFLEGRS